MSGRDPVPVAVVGGGNMGANHIRVYDELPEAELVGVVEPDPERAEEIADEYGVPVIDRVADLEGARAATVAVPNRFHREVAETCINNGIDVLVEKPLATTIEEAKAIVDAARGADVMLQVGHIERFNPAVEMLQDLLENMNVLAVETHRLGPFNEHLTDESVVFDLLIHDVDIVQSILRENINKIQAMGIKHKSSNWDQATAMLQYPDSMAVLTASHVTHGKVRKMNITAKECFIELNYQTQQIELQQHGSEQTTSILGQSGYTTEKKIESPFVSTREPLKNELEHFLNCIRTRTQPKVSGEDGLEAIRLINSIESELER